MRHVIRLVSACGIVAGTALLAACDYLPFLGTHHEPPTQGQQAEQYQRAIAYKEKSDCAHAIPLLEPLAKRGHGFEIAQFQLGQCYLERARSAASPADAERTRSDGAEWILKAANSQIPSAQQAAIQLYEDGTGVTADPIEAGKWLLLLQHNPLRRVFGPAVIDPDIEQRLNKRLTREQWAVAQQRADRWQPVEQPTILPPPEPDTTPRRSQR